ncbi:MMPL family transporter [Corynebacterium xerosis]|uniref:MMPL family transporter n=1 Tax=Corynebacterium xerosis TaxID=1725 RepID=UPI0027BA1D1E|nr:MMPL family transporter [Corynebacterium xerosis]
MGRTGEVLASSAGTIILAMMALLFTSSPSLQGFGPYLAIGVGSMAVVAATFLPALLLVAGRSVFWPGGEERALRRVDSPLWEKISSFVEARPKAVLAGALALLIVLSAGLVGYKESYNFLTGFRVDTDSAAGQQVIAEELGVGEIAPVTLLVEGRGIDAAARDALADAGVEEVEVAATGETATSADIRSALESDTLLLIPLILGIIGLVLGLLLRSILAPVYLVATLALSFVATVGLTTFFAVPLQGDSGIGNRVTAYILVFLTALGVDYTIFLMSRVRQELAHSGMREALRTSLVRTGGVVSSAGLILAATFSVLMTQPIRDLYQFGLALALGILLDTFVVLPLLVPAIVRLIGDRALWPIAPAKSDAPADDGKAIRATA